MALKAELDPALFYKDPEKLSEEERAALLTQMKAIAERHRAVRAKASQEKK